MSPVLAEHTPGLELNWAPAEPNHAALGRTLDAETHCLGGVSEAGVVFPGMGQAQPSLLLIWSREVLLLNIPLLVAPPDHWHDSRALWCPTFQNPEGSAQQLGTCWGSPSSPL